MPSSRPNIPALAEDLVRVDGLFDRRDERVALALYRLLGEGEPVSAERLAAAIQQHEVLSMPTTVFFDGDGNQVGDHAGLMVESQIDDAFEQLAAMAAE